MKTNHLKALVAALILTSYASFASAAGSATVQVNAKVVAACKFTAATMTAIDLGTINQATVPAAGVTGTTNVTYQCTKGTTPVVSVSTGGTTLTSGSDTVPYTFTLGTADAGTGFSAAAAATKVVATATIAQTDAQDAVAGTYADTVTLSINN